MDRRTTDYRDWQLTLYPGRTWVGSAKRERTPFDVIIVRGFSDWEVLADLRKRVDEIEDARDKREGKG